MADGVTSVLREVGSEAFWRQHFPNLSITETLTPARAQEIIDAPPKNTMPVNIERMNVDGYFHDSNETITRLAPVLADAIRTCKRLDIPPAFIFLFDEAWECFFSLHHALAPFLGDYAILPDFWVWHVDHTAEEAGWTPHRDKGVMALAPDGSPLSLTVWLPLTESNPLNGCMYILPKSRDPVYGTSRERDWQVDFPLIRALPAKPGDFLCWNQAVLHWGGVSSRFAQAPRMSMALEFQRTDIAPFNQPLLPAFGNLDFRSRLWLIGKQIMQYRHMYKVRPEFEALAQSLLTS